MDYTEYLTQDFLADESFQNYIMGTDPAAAQFWPAWLKQHPEKEAAASESAALLTILSSGNHLLPSSAMKTMKSAEAAKLWAAISPPEQPT